MADHTVVNLREVDDSAVKFGYAPDLSARFATGALELEKSGMSLQGLAPGKRAPFGHRDGQEELYVVVAGSGRVKIDDEIVELRQWDAVRVAPGAARQFEAGPDGIEFLAFGAPRAGHGDAEMLGEWWTD